MTIDRVPVWSTIVPRYSATHEDVAGRFAGSSPLLGGPAWISRGLRPYPVQFHVAGDSRTYEIERDEVGEPGEADGRRHRFVVRVLVIECERQAGEAALGH